jgi:hypothetical protein
MPGNQDVHPLAGKVCFAFNSCSILEIFANAIRTDVIIGRSIDLHEIAGSIVDTYNYEPVAVLFILNALW